MEAYRYFCNRVRALESDPAMRKGQLMERVLADDTIRWEAIYPTLSWKGRHRHKKRWRRALIVSVLHRRFPRGGRRRRRGGPPSAAPPQPQPQEVGGPEATTEGMPPRAGPSATAPPAVRAVSELADVSTEDVWNRFRVVYPILAVYRTGWNPSTPVAHAHPKKEWDDLWTAAAGADPAGPGKAVTLRDIAHSLGWPAELDSGLPLVSYLATRLWPAHPWNEWMSADADAFRRDAIPFLRRAACLLHGFVMGGCNPHGVWEAIRLPERLRPVSVVVPIGDRRT
jgi:hypothetical protein